MTETKKMMCSVLPNSLVNEVFSYMCPNQNRYRKIKDGLRYYYACCHVGLEEEILRLRPKFHQKDVDALTQVVAGNHMELTQKMLPWVLSEDISSAYECAAEKGLQEILEYIIEAKQQWFLSLHATGVPQKRKHIEFVESLLFLGACMDSEYLVRYSLDRGGGDEIYEAENVALERKCDVAKVINDYIEAL
jgi:hypothetical protein